MFAIPHAQPTMCLLNCELFLQSQALSFAVFFRDHKKCIKIIDFILLGTPILLLCCIATDSTYHFHYSSLINEASYQHLLSTLKLNTSDATVSKTPTARGKLNGYLTSSTLQLPVPTVAHRFHALGEFFTSPSNSPFQSIIRLLPAQTAPPPVGQALQEVSDNDNDDN